METQKKYRAGVKTMDPATAEEIGRSRLPISEVARNYNVSKATVRLCRDKYRQREPSRSRGTYAKRIKSAVRCKACGYTIETNKCLICEARRVARGV